MFVVQSSTGVVQTSTVGERHFVVRGSTGLDFVVQSNTFQYIVVRSSTRHCLARRKSCMSLRTRPATVR